MWYQIPENDSYRVNERDTSSSEARWTDLSSHLHVVATSYFLSSTRTTRRYLIPPLTSRVSPPYRQDLPQAFAAPAGARLYLCKIMSQCEERHPRRAVYSGSDTKLPGYSLPYIIPKCCSAITAFVLLCLPMQGATFQATGNLLTPAAELYGQKNGSVPDGMNRTNSFYIKLAHCSAYNVPHE